MTASKDFNMYGVSRIDPIQFYNKLLKLNEKQKFVSRINVASGNKNVKPSGILLFLNADEAISFAMKHYKLGKRRFTPVIFDVKESMQKKHITLIDDIHSNTHTACMRVLDGRNSKKAERFNANFYSRSKFVMDKIEIAKEHGGFFTTYNGLLYSISNIDLRNAFKENMLKYLYGKHGPEIYTKNLLRFRPKKKTAIEKFAMLLAAVSHPDAAALRHAVMRVMKGEDVKECSEELKVPAFDIRYVLSQRGAITKAKKG